jgi:RND family efflux transporter MFP subunit
MTAILSTQVSCSSKNEQPSESIDSIQKREGIPVHTHQVKVETLHSVLKYSGDVSGQLQKDVYAVAPEFIKEIKVAIGQPVKQGQILAVLDAQGNTPQYRQVKAAYEIAKSTYERLKSVYEQGGVAMQQMQEAETQFKIMQANYDAVSKTINIEAPISGVITNIYAKAGEVAIAGRDENPFLQISKIDKVLIRFNVPPSEIFKIKKNQEARVKIGDSIINGKITQVPMAANPVTRSFTVEALFDNQQRLLKPGMFTTLEIISATEEAPGIPLEAIQIESDKYFVYKIENGKSTKVEFKPGLITDEFISVRSGITEKDLIVTKGQTRLESGSKVKVVNPGAQ